MQLRLSCLIFLICVATASAAELKTRNVFLISTDGLRWEEVFRGADTNLLGKEFGDGLASSAEERRKLLMPFFWNEIAARGQLFGNRDKKADVRVTNGKNFSYPGYNEFLTGIADPKIDSNDKNLNANTNVFEWLQMENDFRDRVAAVVNWDVLPWILNGPRAGFPIWSAFEMPAGTKRVGVNPLIDEMAERSKTIWGSVILDTFIGAAAKDCVRTMKPRAMYISYGETDDWAHDGAYERYLKAAREFDRFVGELWGLVQSMPEYRGTTTFVITTDHGRGPAPVAWKNHGGAIQDSAYMWMAAIGPDIEALGERSEVALVTQAQVAATVAAVVGKNFTEFSPRSAAAVSFKSK